MSEHAPYDQVTLEVIDQAINDWFDRTVDAHVQDQSKQRKKVPVHFASGERWINSREKKGLRDKNGMIILPVITLRRTGIDPSSDMAALGTETPTIQISKRISQKTNNLRNLSKLRVPSQRIDGATVYEVTTIPFPDRSILTYDVNIQTQYIVQMNSILEKIFHELDIQKSFVAPLVNNHRHPKISVPFEERGKLKDPYIVGFFDSSVADGGNLDEFTDTERIVRFTTTIRVPTVLQLDPEGEEPAIKVEKTSFKLNFGEESVHFVDDPEELELIFGNGRIREPEEK
jgi:hypothetical protein